MNVNVDVDATQGDVAKTSGTDKASEPASESERQPPPSDRLVPLRLAS